MLQINRKLIKQIQHFFPDLHTRFNVPWSELTTLGVGDSVQLVVSPSDDLTLSRFLKFCSCENIKILPIGSGSNTVGADNIYPGIILKLTQNNFSRIRISHVHVTAGAGVRLYDFIVACAHQNLGGIEQLAGIPGVIGGSLRTNAGRLGVSIGDVIEEICGFDFNGNPWCADSKEINWRYRNSSIPNDVIVTAAIFKMKKIKSEILFSTLQENLFARKNIFPSGRNAGCVFKNPPSGHGAGKLIELSGCKGLMVGKASVSKSHANFFINNGNATERDFVELAVKVRTEVLRHTGIYLNPEVFFTNPKSRDYLESHPKQLSVTLLKGGNSRERVVSLESAQSVSKALNDGGYKVIEEDIQTPDISETASKADIIFPMIHGGFGENGKIQQTLEKLKIPFIGCSSSASKIMIDKIKTKKIFNDNNIRTPDYAILESGCTEFPKHLSLPVVVKPPTEGSTFGITIVKKMNEWQTALDKASHDNSGLILVEEYIEGIELTAGILINSPLPLVQICFPGETYDFDAKYTHNSGETIYIAPPHSNCVSMRIQEEIKVTALKIFNLFNARDMLRVDLILSTETMIPYYLEINSIPGFTSSSLLPKAATAANIPYIQLCGTLVQAALKRNMKDNNITK